VSATETLLAQQRCLQRAIVGEPDTAGLLRPRTDGSPPLLAVYRHAYRARLVAALADNHTVLQRALGDEAFDALGRAYAEACPSTRPSIRWYGDRLADFMAAREDLVPHPALVDIARMDWALRDAFDAADAAAVDLAALAGLAPEHWAQLRFEPHPSVRLVPLRWAVEGAWRALREHDPASGGDEPQLPAPEPHPHLLLVWRRGLETQWRSLPAAEAALLQAALEGARFDALCEQAARSARDSAEAASVAAASLQQWLQDGLFARFTVPG
jgi:hypothetical protein